MKLEIIGDRAVLTNDDGKAVINVHGECCTVNGIRDTLEGIDDAAKVIEKIKLIQSLLDGSKGDTRVEQPTLKDSDVSAIRSMHEEDEGVKPIINGRYMNRLGEQLIYKGNNIFVNSHGLTFTLSEDALKSLIEL